MSATAPPTDRGSALAAYSNVVRICLHAVIGSLTDPASEIISHRGSAPSFKTLSRSSRAISRPLALAHRRTSRRHVGVCAGVPQLSGRLDVDLKTSQLHEDYRALERGVVHIDREPTFTFRRTFFHEGTAERSVIRCYDRRPGASECGPQRRRDRRDYALGTSSAGRPSTHFASQGGSTR